MPDQDGLPAPARYRAMAVIILGIALSVIDGTIVNLALPSVTRDLHSTAAQAIWVVNAYQVAILAVLLPFAMVGDLLSYRRVYLSGLGFFTVASLVCALADSLPWLTAARAVQGLGAAGIMSVNAALVRLTYPRRLLGRGIAINSIVVATASVAGPTIAAGILSVASWHWLFAVNLPLGVVVLWLGKDALPHNPVPPNRSMRLPWPDVLLNALTFSLVFLGADALGTKLAGPDRLPDVTGVAMLVGGVLLGVVYVCRQLGQAVPLLPVDLLRIPVFGLSMCTSVAAFGAQTLAYIALPFQILDGYGRSALQTGMLMTAWPLAIVFTAPIAGRLIGRVSDGLLGGIGLGLMAVGLSLLAALPAQPSNADIVWRLALCGIGFGLFQSPNNHTILTSAPPHRSGGASGMLGTARLTGQTLGAVLLAIIFSVGHRHDRQAVVMALILAACFSVAASVFSVLRLRPTQRLR